jgi:hypothetical protein
VTPPHFIIGGAPRSGTTALARALDRHPRVTMAKPLLPEPKVLLVCADPLARYQEIFSGVPAGQLLGEKTSNLFEDPAAPERVAHLLPSVRMVFALREPVARAYSNWLWTCMNGYETLSFEEAVAREGDRPDPPGLRPGARPFAYVARSRYGELSERWLSALGPDRVHFVLFEQVVGPGAHAALEGVQRFLGLEPRTLEPVPTRSGTESDPAAPPLAAQTRRALAERLRPEIDRLRAATDLDVSVWDA